MSFGFRFYGRKPSGSYAYGYYTVHHWDVAFRAVPDEATKEALATYYESIDAGPGRAVAEPWLWSGRFARVPFREFDFQKLYSATAKLFETMHGLSPIEDIAYCGSGGLGRGQWQTWSEDRQAKPTAGPAYADGIASPRPHDSTLQDAAADTAFEAARKAASRVRRDAELAALNDGSPIQLSVSGSHDPDAAAAAALREHGLEPTGDEVIHPITRGRRPLYCRRPDKDSYKVTDLSYVDGGRLTAIPFAGELSWTAASNADGSRAIAVVDYTCVAEFDATADTTSRRMTASSPINALQYIGDLWSVRTAEELLIVDPSATPPAQVAKAKLKGKPGAWQRSLFGGRIIVANTVGKTDKMVVYGYCEGKLKKFATLPLRAWDAFEVAGDAVVSSSTPSGREFLVLGGVMALWEEWSGPISAKADAKRQKGGKATAKTKRPTAKLVLEPRDAAPAAYEPSMDPTTGARFDGTAYGTTVGDVTVALVRRNDEAWNDYVVSWCVADGDVVTIEPEEASALGVGARLRGHWMSRNGERALMTARYDGWFLLVEPRTKARTAWEPANTNGTLTTAHLDLEDTIVAQFEPRGRGKWAHLGRHIDLLVRKRGAWVEVDSVKVSGSRAMVARDDIVVVLADAKKSAVVYTVDGEHLVKVGDFQERIQHARFDDDGRLFFLTPEEAVFEVVGLAAVAEKKRAAAAKRRNKG